MGNNVDKLNSSILHTNASMREAIEKLNTSGYQIVLVVDDHRKLLGTITDGDIRRALINSFQLDSKVTEIMHSHVRVVSQNVSRAEVLRIMKLNNILQVPVVDSEGVVVGLHLWNEFENTHPRSNVMVIMAGGRGTRLLPLTTDTPKPMLEVAGKPILEHIIRRASAQGIFNFVITLNYLGDVIETHFKDGERYGVSISYVRENEPLGTAGALSLIRDSFHEPVIVTNGDVLTEFSYTSILDFHINNNAEATMAIREYEWQNPFGVVKLTGVDIVDYEEKPVTKTQINAGVYVIEPSSLKEIPYASYCDMPTLFSMIRDTGKRVIAFPIHESWLDIGRPVDLHAANSRLGQQID